MAFNLFCGYVFFSKRLILLGVKKESLGCGILCSGTIICDSVSTSVVSVGSLFPVHCNETVGASKQISFGCLLASFFFLYLLSELMISSFNIFDTC
jgi:hypothetical protein